MTRSIDATSLVALPQLNAPSARALVQELVTAAEAEKKLSKDVAAALAKLQTADAALAKAASGALAGTQTADQKAADHAEDAVWSGLFDVLTGFTKLPEGFAQGPLAHKLLDQLFPDRLGFTRLPFKAEWAEVEGRLAKLKTGGLEGDVSSLAGDDFLKAIREVHAAYGEALGVTKAKIAPAPKKVRAALDAVLKALRSYVLKVAAVADEDEPKSVELVARLLQPVTSWESRQAPRGKKAAKKPATPSAGGAAKTAT